MFLYMFDCFTYLNTDLGVLEHGKDEICRLGGTATLTSFLVNYNILKVS